MEEKSILTIWIIFFKVMGCVSVWVIYFLLVLGEGLVTFPALTFVTFSTFSTFSAFAALAAFAEDFSVFALAFVSLACFATLAAAVEAAILAAISAFFAAFFALALSAWLTNLILFFSFSSFFYSVLILSPCCTINYSHFTSFLSASSSFKRSSLKGQALGIPGSFLVSIHCM